MAILNNQRECTLSEEELIKLVRESQEGYIQPGTKIAGNQMLFQDGNPKLPKHDVLYYWRHLFLKSTDEYDFAMKAFGDFHLYNRFKNCSVHYRNDLLPTWIEELELSQRSKALKEVVSAVKSGDTKSAQWLEKHLMTNNRSEGKRKSKKDKKEQTDKVWDSIESTYDSLH